jgi:phage baseplate assembly protein W
MSSNFINITFPFKNSDNGFFVALNNTNKDAIKSNLMHLLLTKKGERYMNPDFGTNLLRFLFEPSDEITLGNIREDLKEIVAKYLPSVTILNLDVSESDYNDYRFNIQLQYKINNLAFNNVDTITIEV